MNRLMSRARVAALAKMLGFKKRDRDSYWRLTPWETAYLYLFVDNPRSWRVSIYPNDSEKEYMRSETCKVVGVEADLLKVMCEWYRELGNAQVKKDAVRVVSKAMDDVLAMRDGR